MIVIIIMEILLEFIHFNEDLVQFTNFLIEFIKGIGNIHLLPTIYFDLKFILNCFFCFHCFWIILDFPLHYPIKKSNEIQSLVDFKEFTFNNYY